MTAGPNTFTSKLQAEAIAHIAISDHDCQQDPAELADLLWLLARKVQPRLVLEIGGWAGGSAWAWHQLPTSPRVITVTLPEQPTPGPEETLPAWWKVIYGDSTDPAVIAQVRRACSRSKPGMVFIDGCHHYDVATSDWENYGPLVAAGGPVIFHDINDFPNHPDLQVHLLWAQLEACYKAETLIAHPGEACGTGILWP